VLPDIKMLNEMNKTIIRAGQRVVDPPLMVSDDGALAPYVGPAPYAVPAWPPPCAMA